MNMLRLNLLKIVAALFQQAVQSIRVHFRCGGKQQLGIVDEKFHGRGIATALSEMLIPRAKERGLKGVTAEVLQANKKMMKMLPVIFTSPL